MSKAFRPPKPFLPSFAPDVFEKKIVRRIHLPGEAAFARDLYRDDPDHPGVLIWAVDAPDKKTVKHIRKLAGEIKKNKGFVAWGKLAIAGALVAFIVLFYAVFKNQILTGLMVNGLESTFGARAEVSGLDFDPLGGRLGWSFVDVADKAKPMTNLFHLGKADLRVDSWQLVNGKVILSKVELPEIRFGTHRSVSGALTSEGSSPPDASAASAPSGGIGDFVSLDQFDANALIQSQLDKMDSLAMAASLKNELTDWSSAASGVQSAASAKIKDFGARYQEQLKQSLSSIRSESDAKDALQKAVDVQGQVNALKTEAAGVQADLAKKKKNYEKRLADLKAASLRDVATLKSQIAHPRNLGTEVVAQALQQVVGPELIKWETEARKVPALLAALKQDQPKKAAPHKRPDRAISFPSPVNPAFWLKDLTGGIGLEDGKAVKLAVANVSSDPDRLGPATFRLDYEGGRTSVTANGTVDARKDAGNRLEVRLTARAVPWNLGSTANAIGLSAFEGTAWFDGTYTFASQGGQTFNAEGRILPEKIAAQKGSFIGSVAVKAVDRLKGQVSGTVQATQPVSGSLSVAVKSGFDNAFDAAMGDLWNDEVKAVTADLTRQWNQKLSDTLGPDGAKQLELLIAQNGQDLKSVDGWKKTVDQRVGDLQKLQKSLSSGKDLKKKAGDAAKKLKLP